MKDGLYRIILHYGVFGIIVRDNIVIETAPMGKWMKGKHINKVNKWVKKRNGKIEWLD